MNYEYLTIEDAQKIANGEITEEKAVETLNKIQDRAMLTELEVDLSNLCIKRRNIINKAIEYIENHSLNFNGECEWELSIEECKELEDILKGENNE